MRSSLLAGAFALAFLLFSSSYAVDWDVELQKAVKRKEFLRAVGLVSGALAEQSFNRINSGDLSGRLFRFAVRTAFWTGFFYLSAELLHDYIEAKLNSSSNFSSDYPFCVLSISCNSLVSTENSYVAVGFSGLGFQAQQGIVGAKFCSGTINFLVNSSSTTQVNFNTYIDDAFLSLLQNSPCPDFVELSEYNSPADVLNDPSNYVDILNILNNSPSTVDTSELPGVEAPPIDDYEYEIELPYPGWKLHERKRKNEEPEFFVSFPSGSTSPATQITPDVYRFTGEDGKEYEYNYETGELTNLTDGEVIADETQGTGTITDETTGETQQIDFGTFTSPGLPDVPRLDTSIDIPERKSLTDLVNSSFSSIPALNILKQLQITGSGVCSFDVPFSLFSSSGGGVINFCQFNSVFNVLGSFILAFAHLFAIWIVFKGD